MPDETKEERIDRELIELLNELRVALPGVQVLFAFLLTVPFASRFEQATDAQKDGYMVALLCTIGGCAFLIAPSAFHRLRFRERDKEALLSISNRFAITGLVFLAFAMTASVFVVTDFLFKGPVTSIVTAATAGLLTAVWFVLPLARRATD